MLPSNGKGRIDNQTDVFMWRCSRSTAHPFDLIKEHVIVAICFSKCCDSTLIKQFHHSRIIIFQEGETAHSEGINICVFVHVKLNHSYFGVIQYKF